MTDFQEGVLVAVFPALIGGVLSAYITARLSMRNFYSQKWWERKAEAYSRIVQSLARLQFAYEKWMADELGETQLSHEYRDELNKQYREARRLLDEATSSGAFIISGKAASCLEKLKDKNAKIPLWENGPYDHYKESSSVVEECISEIRECAKEDLHKK